MQLVKLVVNCNLPWSYLCDSRVPKALVHRDATVVQPGHAVNEMFTALGRVPTYHWFRRMHRMLLVTQLFAQPDKCIALYGVSYTRPLVALPVIPLLLILSQKIDNCDIKRLIVQIFILCCETVDCGDSFDIGNHLRN